MTMSQKREDDRQVRRQIGENVESRRAELGISQAECARRAEVPVSELAALESGDRQPLASTLERVAAALEWEPSDALAGVRWSMPHDHDHGHMERERRCRR
jgi:transcriptional regulator with XRE-family HTH domain